ncbi:MAG: hydantoinase B/oxoprolinase family protein [Rhodobacteraceae bacterium]|nr:hydantoinase B/oxoprolinase family protein [Paracoccaceae bacterium]
MTVSNVDQAIINRSLIAAAHEMGTKLIRSAHSPIVREAQDCSAAIIDRQGRVVAQAELIPIQLGSITQTLAPCIDLYPPETLEDGDFFINNDPYHGGQHIPDIFLFSPIFFEGELLGFSASVVHHIDLGGGAPGLNPSAGDVHQEGLVLPPLKYNLNRDWNGGPFERLIAANVRMPQATIGDINAQFAANSIGAKRLQALASRFGRDVLDDAMEEMLNYSERRMRTAIAGLPNGTYCAEAAMDDDGLGDTPVVIRAQVTISGDAIHIGFDGTDPQVPTYLNNPFASTFAAAVACSKSVLTDPDIPFNDGVSRVISVEAPLGSVLNPKPPAPVRARLLPSYRVYNAVMKALAQVVPDKVVAEGYDTTTPVCLSHLGEGGYNIYLEILGGGYGASKVRDGCDGVDSPLSNCANIPIESLEMDYPFLRINQYALIDGSGGDGGRRGGMGFERSYHILDDGVQFATYGDRFTRPAEGLFGGANGAPARNYIERDGRIVELRSKTGCKLEAGDLLVVRTGGGGGYGPPLRSSSD